jgi:predicted ATP-grasp superfamily ATP-dependent carboligase
VLSTRCSACCASWAAEAFAASSSTRGPLGPARFSRYSAQVQPSPAYDSDDFWPWLVALQERLGLHGWLLIPTDDEQVRQIAIHIEEARQRFKYVGPAWSEYELLYDKRASYRWCLEHGVPAPRSFLPANRDDEPTELPRPYIIKPAFKRNFSKLSKAKAFPIEQPSERRPLLEEPLASLPVDEMIATFRDQPCYQDFRRRMLAHFNEKLSWELQEKTLLSAYHSLGCRPQ